MTSSSEYGAIPLDILDDLSSRFIINIPEGERKDPIRLFFQIELAHWFYLDFHRTENSRLKSCGMKEFTKHILKHIPSYSFMLPNLDMYYDKWKEYKMSVPTYGAILLNDDMTKVLLVQSYFERTSWGFPKGKVNEDEDPVKCAVREVLEETGCDISSLIKPEEFLEAFLMEQRVRLYIVHGIKETEEFRPQTRNEIKCVEWFTINDLPTSKKDTTPKLKAGVRPNSFFMVLPFVRRIKNWIQDKRGEDAQPNRKRQRHKSVGDASNYPPGFPVIPPFQGIQPFQAMPFRPPLLSPSAAALISNRRQGEMGNRSFSEQRNPIPSVKNQSKDVKIQNTPKNVIRRQLFSNGTVPESVKNVADQKSMIVPSWLNFKLDWEPLLRCFDI